MNEGAGGGGVAAAGRARCRGGRMLVSLVLLAAMFVSVPVRPAGAIGPGAQRVTDVPGSPYRPGEAVVALTFDDGPDPLTTPRLLDTLAAKAAKATFFVLGGQAARYPDLIRRIAREGHVVAGHTWRHVRLTGLGEEAFRKEVDETNSLLSSLTGQKVRCVRPPQGISDASVVGRLRARGLTTVQWSSDPRDWTRPGVAAIEQRVLGSLRPGAVVVMHDWRGAAQTPAALPGILDGIAARGYRAVSICGDGTAGPVRPAIFAFGSAPPVSTGDLVSRSALAGVAGVPAGPGLRLTAADGGVFAFGGASFVGSAPAHDSPVVAASSTPSGSGYWLVRANGNVAAFGDARMTGSAPTPLHEPVVAMAVGRSGAGYWLVAGDGGVFAFGDAPFRGAVSVPAGQGAVGMASRLRGLVTGWSPSALVEGPKGRWLVLMGYPFRCRGGSSSHCSRFGRGQ